MTTCTGARQAPAYLCCTLAALPRLLLARLSVPREYSASPAAACTHSSSLILLCS
jgi:hypothetical protein